MKLLLVVITSFGLLALAGCNTMEGFGEDVQAGGKAVEKAAEKNKR